MCIIAIKNKGVKAPSSKTIETCWVNNDDGAGFAWFEDGVVHARKGFMKLKDFQQALADLYSRIDIEQVPVIYHFRIGTSGGNVPENTHPFPITNHLHMLQKTKFKAPLVMFHNGVISIKPRKTTISDTMEYVMQIVHPMNELNRAFYLKNIGKKMLLETSGSKLAFLDNKGRVSLVGDFIEEPKTGLLFSNHTYEYAYRYSSVSYSSYYDTLDDYKESFAPTGAESMTLQYVDLEQCYIWDDYGRKLSTEGEFFIDKLDRVYVYDFDNDCAIRTKGKAYHFDGTPFVYGEGDDVYFDNVNVLE